VLGQRSDEQAACQGDGGTQGKIRARNASSASTCRPKTAAGEWVLEAAIGEGSPYDQSGSPTGSMPDEAFQRPPTCSSARVVFFWAAAPAFEMRAAAW